MICGEEGYHIETNRKKIMAIHGSPRKNGNTSTLLNCAVRGALEQGACVEEVYLCDLNIFPCFEKYDCSISGACSTNDDFCVLENKLMTCDGLMFSSPVFFFHVSAQFKTFIDRCQALWIKKHWINKNEPISNTKLRNAIFVSVGALTDDNLFEGILLSLPNFLDALNAKIWKTFLYKGIEAQEDILKYPAYMDALFIAGKNFADII